MSGLHRGGLSVAGELPWCTHELSRTQPAPSGAHCHELPRSDDQLVVETIQLMTWQSESTSGSVKSSIASLNTSFIDSINKSEQHARRRSSQLLRNADIAYNVVFNGFSF